jgi:hypothetical protein
MRRELNGLLVAALFVTSWAWAQTNTPATETTAPFYLLRLERAQYLQSVCLLLDANGQYHLERHNPQKVRVFEGTLNADELRDIIRIVSRDQLFRLEQKQIPDLMLKSDSDQVMLEIHRPGSWQELFFSDSASREPFRDAMDPLLKWLDAVNKRKVRELSEEAGRNNCLPPSKPEFARRNNGQPQQSVADAPTPANVPPQPAYTLQMFDNRMVNYQTQVTCLLISTSGAYHLVKQSKSYSRGMSSAVLDGTLAPPEMASLRTLLDTPDLVNEPEEKQEVEVIFTGDSYFTRLAIPRAGKVQKIAAWKSYRIINHTMTRSVEDHGTRLLAPLREWLKININEKSAIPTATPPNPRCSPGG